MTKYVQNGELDEPIVKGRYYGVKVDFPIYMKNFLFTAYLRVGSTFTEMDMNQIAETENYIQYKIQIENEKTATLSGSGKCEIQISVVDSTGNCYDVLVLDCFLESSKPIYKGGKYE